ncbi:hypothetical protein CLV43_103410 [Umezawaea tangerina]|uniref:Uncharacterized protein n=1 Tax=Umezawaea tangerina TaxID=84725 RepID=A0A2T0TDB3_9PSEU|nr:hypothetical protein CLV43_103410 [Umezawaea tangerina]
MAGAEPASSTPARLRAAFGLAAVGALLAATAPLLGVVSGGTSPAYTAWPLLVLLALLPAVLAGAFLFRDHPAAAAGVLAATAFFAPGRLLVDLQILADTTYTTRPELFRPTSLTPLTPGVGLWLLVAGHVLVLAAGLLAAVGTDAGDVEDTDQASTRKFLGLVVVAGAVAAIGLFMAPITSSDPLVPTGGPFDAPALAMIGGLLLALAAPAAGVLAASNPAAENRRGGLLAIAAALAAIALPPFAAGLFADRLGVSIGSVLLLLAAAAHAVLARFLGRDTTPEDTAEPHAVELPGLRRLNVTAGVLGLVAAASALGGVLVPQLVVPDGLALPVGYGERLLWPALVVVAVLAAVLVANVGAVRPAFTVALAALPLAAGAALDSVYAATQVGSVKPGNGVWFTVLAVVLAIAAAVTAALAGALEREDVEPAKTQAPLPMVAFVLIGGLLALGGFALPVLRGPDFHAVGLLDFKVGSWGLLAGLLAVVAAAGLALLARPSRAGGLLLGAALVTAVRAVEYPLTSARVTGATPGPGLWLAVAGAIALLAGAAVSASRR